MRDELIHFDLNLLVAFDTLMTERGVTRASRRLGITQAAMSNTLRRLRDRFGDPLFTKVGQHMEPTARALEMAEPVQEALRHVSMVLTQEGFDPTLSQHVFRIGMVDYASACLLPRLLQRLRQVAPGVSLEVIDTGGDDEITVLESGNADLVLSRFQWVPPKVRLHRLWDWEYVCIHRANHPLVTAEGLTLDAMLQVPHVHYFPRGMSSTVVDEVLAEMGKSRHVVARLHALTLVPFMVAKSDMMAVMPSGAAYYLAPPLGLEVSRLPFKTAKLRLALAWHPRSDRSPPNIWLRELVKEVLQDPCDPLRQP